MNSKQFGHYRKKNSKLKYNNRNHIKWDTEKRLKIFLNKKNYHQAVEPQAVKYALSWSPEEEKEKKIFDEIMHKKFSKSDESYKPTDPKISTNLKHKKHNFVTRHYMFKLLKKSDREKS